MGTMERQPAPRIPLTLDIEYRRSYARSDDLGKLLNISLSGAFLEHDNGVLRDNGKLCITFKVSGRIRKIHATVIWTNQLGSGIKFQPTNNRDVQIVDDLIYFVESTRETRRSVLDTIFKKVG